MNSHSPDTSRSRAIATFTALPAIVLMGSAVWYSLPDPDPERGGIAVTVRAKTPSGAKLAASRVYFVRLGDEEEIPGAETVVWSNHSANKQVYVLNAKPGRYMAVAAGLTDSGGAKYAVFFDKETILLTEIRVVPGEFTFMGDFVVGFKSDMNRSDEAQSFYLGLIELEVSRAVTREYVYRGELLSAERHPEAERKFWILARDKFFKKTPQWRERVERQLTALSSD